jgi:glucose uptake protein GlcU
MNTKMIKVVLPTLAGVLVIAAMIFERQVELSLIAVLILATGAAVSAWRDYARSKKN